MPDTDIQQQQATHANTEYISSDSEEDEGAFSRFGTGDVESLAAHSKIHTFGDLLRELGTAQNIVVLCGAGISTSLGIPDFRSADGLYKSLDLESLGLSDPQEVFDLEVFDSDPTPFYRVASKVMMPTQALISPTHAFLKLLQDKGKLLRIYTQNIDDLEHIAGIEESKMVQCHGAFHMATCRKCGAKVTCESLRPEIEAGEIPMCRRKRCDGVIKPDIVFFGESLPDRFRNMVRADITMGGPTPKVDLFLCLGTSLKVSPACDIARQVPLGVPRVYINREPSARFYFDISLCGESDLAVQAICEGMGWELTHPQMKPMEQ